MRAQTIAPHHERPPAILNSMLTLAFDPVRTSGGVPLDALQREAEALAAFVRAAPQDPAGAVFFPGERAAQRRAERRESLALDQGTWASLQRAAKELNADTDDLFRAAVCRP